MVYNMKSNKEMVITTESGSTYFYQPAERSSAQVARLGNKENPISGFTMSEPKVGQRLRIWVPQPFGKVKGIDTTPIKNVEVL